eukprot:gene25160-19335_t
MATVATVATAGDVATLRVPPLPRRHHPPDAGGSAEEREASIKSRQASIAVTAAIATKRGSLLRAPPTPQSPPAA